MKRTAHTACMLLLLGLSLRTEAAPPSPPAGSLQAQACEQAIHRGCQWLMDRQSADGGWHSLTYGRMKPGAGNTALILDTFSRLPDHLRKETQKSVADGVTFLTRTRTPGELVQLSEDPADYPVYATALLVSAIRRLQLESREELLPAFTQALLREQRTVEHGWAKERPDLGGWSPWQTNPSQAEGEFPANVSTTACVLEALQVTDCLSPEVKASATAFVDRCRGDGQPPQAFSGFAFTPQADSPLNKLGLVTDTQGVSRPRPYHSATCDGIRTLLALGFTAAEEKGAALSALSGLPPAELLSLPIDSDAAISPQSALFFYDAATFSHVWQRTRDDRLSAPRSALLQALLKSQQEGGSWKNPLPWYHEDDPLIATALAISAICQLQN